MKDNYVTYNMAGQSKVVISADIVSRKIASKEHLYKILSEQGCDGKKLFLPDRYSDCCSIEYMIKSADGDVFVLYRSDVDKYCYYDQNKRIVNLPLNVNWTKPLIYSEVERILREKKEKPLGFKLINCSDFAFLKVCLKKIDPEHRAFVKVNPLQLNGV
jgi:hypothetical protein